MTLKMHQKKYKEWFGLNTEKFNNNPCYRTVICHAFYEKCEGNKERFLNELDRLHTACNETCSYPNMSGMKNRKDHPINIYPMCVSDDTKKNDEKGFVIVDQSEGWCPLVHYPESRKSGLIASINDLYEKKEKI